MPENTTFTIPLTKVIEEFELEKLYEPEDIDTIAIVSSDINRPGLQMVGFFENFDKSRIQIMGRSEFRYLDQFRVDEREKIIDRFFQEKFPALIITRGQQIFPEMVELAEKYNITLLRTEEDSSSFMSAFFEYVNIQVAPRRTRHGVLVEVYGEGILILGESGVGKSEAAIELVKRGHRIIADDAVEIKKLSSTRLVGSSPAIIRHFVELRGIGIIDVKEIFGIGAIKDSGNIDMIIHLEPWEEGRQYDRLGMIDEFTNIMGVNVPSLTIPVKLGRNLAVIIEVAAMNNRQKQMGYNAAVELNKRLMRQMEEQLNL
ncbi:MAG: HPr(Ser) kinase/phosphatase [Clostridiales bacterium]|nr:HPr(Ser) kinase/phosphatase [Clostridiales bacterium]